MKFKKRLWLIGLVIASEASFANSFIIKNNQDEVVKDIVVYLQPQFSDDFSLYYSSHKKYDVLQKRKKFTPYITVITKGSTPTFTNKDDITHHIYSAIGPKRFSFKLKAEKSKQDVVFDNTGHVAMGCNIHDWMSGHILVVDTPFYGLTDNAGTIIFNKIPAGKYKLNVWHPQLETQNNLQSSSVDLPLTSPMKIRLNAAISPIPDQSTLDAFEFLEDY